MAGDSPATALSPIPEVKVTEDFLGFASEPFAAVVPVRGRTRLVHLSQAPKVRGNIPLKKRIPGRPTPFKRTYGDEIPFLPLSPAPDTTPADVSSATEGWPDETSWVEYVVKRCGMRKFLVQIDRARAYFRGSDYWRLRTGDDLTPKKEGYPVSWLRDQAECHPDGKNHGFIDEAAVLVAARIEELVVFTAATGGLVINR